MHLKFVIASVWGDAVISFSWFHVLEGNKHVSVCENRETATPVGPTIAWCGQCSATARVSSKLSNTHLREERGAPCPLPTVSPMRKAVVIGLFERKMRSVNTTKGGRTLPEY